MRERKRSKAAASTNVRNHKVGLGSGQHALAPLLPKVKALNLNTLVRECTMNIFQLSQYVYFNLFRHSEHALEHRLRRTKAAPKPYILEDRVLSRRDETKLWLQSNTERT